ncbi:MAG: hypothetical protein LBE67_06510 [Kocuria palustris]|nr:hypothetical protein [Kocuria palustris]
MPPCSAPARGESRAPVFARGWFAPATPREHERGLRAASTSLPTPLPGDAPLPSTVNAGYLEASLRSGRIPVIMGISVPDQRGGGPWACRVTTRRARAPAAVREIPSPSPHFASRVASTSQ